jgi:hypothetical protein
MSEHYLERAQIGPVFQKVRRKGMPEHVRGDVYADARFSSAAFNYLPDALPRYALASGVDKDLGDKTLFQ